MAEMQIYKDGKLVSTKTVNDKTADNMLDAFDNHGEYVPQEYPKVVETKVGKRIAADEDAEKVMMADDFSDGVEGDHFPMAATGPTEYVTPVYIGDGYGRVNNRIVSDDRHHEADAAEEDKSGIAKGPIRTNAQAAMQDVAFSTGEDPVELLKDKAQENKDEMAAQPEKSGVASAKATVATGADIGAVIPDDAAPQTNKTPEGDSSKDSASK